jgi:hypothetical protein
MTAAEPWSSTDIIDAERFGPRGERDAIDISLVDRNSVAVDSASGVFAPITSDAVSSARRNPALFLELHILCM